MHEHRIIMNTDGASRGNPGPASVGVVIQDGNQNRNYREFIGYATNNEAEYKALIFGLAKLKQLHGKGKAKQIRLECRLDSELVVKQLNHEYKISEEHIQKLFIQVWNATVDFNTVNFKHIPREQNKDADHLANQALDEATRAQSRFF